MKRKEIGIVLDEHKRYPPNENERNTPYLIWNIAPCICTLMKKDVHHVAQKVIFGSKCGPGSDVIAMQHHKAVMT